MTIWYDYEILALIAATVHPSYLGELPPHPRMLARKAEIMGFSYKDVRRTGEYVHRWVHDEHGSYLITTLKPMPSPWVALPC